MKLKNIEEDEIHRGFVICDRNKPCLFSNQFKAEIEILDVSANKPIITKGFECMVHCHTAVEEGEILLAKMIVEDKKNPENEKKELKFLKLGDKGEVVIKVLIRKQSLSKYFK